MAKETLGIKTTPLLKKNVSKLLDTAKELGDIQEKEEYFQITLPYFEDYLKRKRLTQSDLGTPIREVEKCTTIIVKQFVNLIESQQDFVKLLESEHEDQLQKKELKIEALSSLLEKTEHENLSLKNVIDENNRLKDALSNYENKLSKLESKYEKELIKKEKELLKKFGQYNDLIVNSVERSKIN